MAPAGFELVVSRADRASLDQVLPNAEYMVCYPNVVSRRRVLQSGAEAQALPVAQRRLRRRRHRGGGPRQGAGLQQRRRQRDLGVRARHDADAHGVAPGGLAARERLRRPLARQRRGADDVRIYDKTLGIVGLGTIGKKVARLANAFRMRVQYYDIARLPEHEEDALGVRFRLFRELLRTSDIVTMHVPLNDSTRHMIGADELALMKPEAIIVNTSRGPVIDEVALTKALADNKLFGAGLDVFDQEPPPPDNPIFKLRNVVLTSHFAGPTWDNHVARFRNAFDNVQRVASRREAGLGGAGAGGSLVK